MDTIKVNKQGFYAIYFKTYSINQKQGQRLTDTEIKILLELIFNFETKLVNPYYGSGREEILRKMGMTTSQFSNNLKSLSAKGLLVKLAQKGEYALSVNIQKLMQKVNESKQMSIFNYYEITEDNVKRNIEENE